MRDSSSLLFSFQDLAHHDTVDDVAAGPAQLQSGSRFGYGLHGFGGGEGSKLLIVAGIIAFAGFGTHTALVNGIIMFRDTDGGLHDSRTEEGKMLP